MSDFRNDPNYVPQEINDYDSRVQWAAVAVILLLVGGIIVAGTYSGGDTQMANSGATVETTGSGSAGSTTMDRPQPQLRR
jgi:hypothetical protein